MRRAALLMCAALLLSGCYRTHYVNFSPANPDRAPLQSEPVRAGRGWQHFFVWGLAPGKRTIDARARCGGTDNVHSIQTRQTALQGLAAAFGNLLIVNVYSPWNGAVYCSERAQTPPR